MSNELLFKRFCYPDKPISHLWIISVFRASLLPWEYLLVKEKEFFCSWKVSKFVNAVSFASARKVDVSEFQVKNKEGFFYGWHPQVTELDLFPLLKIASSDVILARTICVPVAFVVACVCRSGLLKYVKTSK